MPATACALSTSARPAKRPYARRQPDKTVLYELVREHLESFLEQGRRRSEHGEGYPAYVERTFRRYQQCGIMAHGCAKLRCGECGHEPGREAVGRVVVEDDGSLRFVELPPPSDDEVEKVARGVMCRVRRLLSRMEDDGALSADEDEGALSTSLIEARRPQGAAADPGALATPEALRQRDDRRRWHHVARVAPRRGRRRAAPRSKASACTRTSRWVRRIARASSI